MQAAIPPVAAHYLLATIMLVTTLTTMLIQYLAQRAWGGVDPTTAWLRGGSIGMWTRVTAAALFGML